MNYLSDLLLALSLVCLLFVLIGLYKPWVMLWWEDTQTRRKVLKVYGLTMIFFYIAHLAISFFF